MSPFEKIHRGMGIAGWMTNYKRMRFVKEEGTFDLTVGDREHIERYLTRWDIQNIRSMGMDHIRVPFDHVVLEEYDKPFRYREDMFALLDRMIGWCLDEGLEVVLNMHHAIGCYCDFNVGVKLLDNDLMMERFLAIWDKIEDRYHDLDIIFEPLNEITSQEAEPWNDLMARYVQMIRAKNPTRRIIIGSPGINRVYRLKDLKLYEDDAIGYTYHFYFPYAFTHQRTTINSVEYAYNREVSYPGPVEVYKDYAEYSKGGDGSSFEGFDTVGREYVERILQSAADFRAAHPEKFLWMGEFGTIRHAPLRCRENWMRDVIRFAIEHGIAYSVWNYLSTPYDCNKFSLVDDDDRRIVSREMLRIIQGHVD